MGTCVCGGVCGMGFEGKRLRLFGLGLEWFCGWVGGFW